MWQHMLSLNSHLNIARMAQTEVTEARPATLRDYDSLVIFTQALAFSELTMTFRCQQTTRVQCCADTEIYHPAWVQSFQQSEMSIRPKVATCQTPHKVYGKCCSNLWQNFGKDIFTIRTGLKPMQPMQLHWAPCLWRPAPWCLGRLFIFVRYTLRLRIQ